jgi:hypothetical protein
MIRKGLSLIFFTALSSHGFALLNPEAFSIGVSGGPAISWDFEGYGTGLKLGYTIEKKDTFEVEFLYMYLDAKSKNYFRDTTRIPSTKGRRQDSYKSRLEEYFLFLNYRHTDNFPFLSTKCLHYYYGLGVGLRRLFAQTDGTNYTATRSQRINGVATTNRTIFGKEKENDTCAAGQIFAGLKLDLSDSVSLSLGGRGIFSKAFQPTSSALINPIPAGNLNIKSSSFTGMLEGSISIYF